MAELTGKIALIAGGAGEVGEGIVRTFLTRGATVIVPSRSPKKLEQLRERLGELAHGRLMTIVGEVSSLSGAARIREWIELIFGKLDIVIASLGEWRQSSQMIETSLADWHSVLDNNLTPHFVTARIFLPLLAKQPNAAYLFINGDAAENPIPHSGLLSIAAAAQLMLKDVLVAEMQDISSGNNTVRINTLMVCNYVASRSRLQPHPEWLTADEVGAYAAYLASEAAAELHGETIRFKDRAQLAKLDAVAA